MRRVATSRDRCYLCLYREHRVSTHWSTVGSVNHTVSHHCSWALPSYSVTVKYCVIVWYFLKFVNIKNTNDHRFAHLSTIDFHYIWLLYLVVPLQSTSLQCGQRVNSSLIVLTLHNMQMMWCDPVSCHQTPVMCPLSSPNVKWTVDTSHKFQMEKKHLNTLCLGLASICYIWLNFGFDPRYQFNWKGLSLIPSHFFFHINILFWTKIQSSNR